MDYAKEYIIPRAVMYDKNIDINNPMFDLNRKIIQEQKDTMVITQDNLSEIVNSIMDKRSSIPNKTPVQDQLL